MKFIQMYIHCFILDPLGLFVLFIRITEKEYKDCYFVLNMLAPVKQEKSPSPKTNVCVLGNAHLLSVGRNGSYTVPIDLWVPV